MVWVVLGNQLYRASVHSLRPLSEREEELFVDESHRWKELRDMVPKRSYIDVTGEEPREGEIEGPHLPAYLDGDTVITPKVRFMAKHSIGASGFSFTLDKFKYTSERLQRGEEGQYRRWFRRSTRAF